MLHTNCVKQLLVISNCIELEPGLEVLIASEGVQCWTATHWSALLSTALPALVFSVGCPLVAFINMRRYHKLRKLLEMNTLVKFGFLYKEYASGCVRLRKLLLRMPNGDVEPIHACTLESACDIYML